MKNIMSTEPLENESFPMYIARSAMIGLLMTVLPIAGIALGIYGGGAQGHTCAAICAATLFVSRTAPGGGRL